MDSITTPNRKETWLQIDDCKLRVITFENNQDTPVLVLLHGGPGSGADPLLELSAFNRLNEIFTTVYFDQRGTGKSYYNLSKQITKEQAASDVHEVVAWAKSEFPNRPVCLWGGSYGGLLSLLYLEYYPNDVDKSVICSPAILSLEQMKSTMENAREDMLNQIEKLPNEYKDIIVGSKENATMSDNPKLDELLSNMQEMPKGFEAIFFVYAIRSWFSTYDAAAVIPKIEIPTLIIHGENDPICPIAMVKTSYENASNPVVKFISFPNCGHATFDDCEDRFVGEISDFLVNK